MAYEGGELCTADWAAWPACAPACVCRLHATAVRSTALVSDESALEVYIVHDDVLYKLTTFTFSLPLVREIDPFCPGQSEKIIPQSSRNHVNLSTLEGWKTELILWSVYRQSSMQVITM